jgi:hypothetical protein
MNQENWTIIIGFVLTALATWINHRSTRIKIAENTELTEQAVKQVDNQFDTIRLLRENDALRQAMSALRIEVDMRRDQDAFMRSDPACAPCIAARQAFIDRRRTRVPVPVVPTPPVAEPVISQEPL